jgi:hypothetical protein
MLMRRRSAWSGVTSDANIVVNGVMSGVSIVMSGASIVVNAVMSGARASRALEL